MTKPPDHYPAGPYEPWLVIDAWGLGYGLGNVLKYIARAGKKGPALDDLVKARNYLDREIDKLANAQLAEDNTSVTESGGNVFEDLGFADAEDRLREAIARRGLPCK